MALAYAPNRLAIALAQATVSFSDSCREFRAKYPQVPIVWGGYFASLYTDAVLNAPYVDIVVRGQGEETFLELIQALKEKRKLAGIPGISFKDDFGLHVHNPDRPLRS